MLRMSERKIERTKTDANHVILTVGQAVLMIEEWICSSDSDTLEDFSSWAAAQLGPEAQNDSPAFIMSKIAFLETFNHVFNIGSGFCKVDISSYTQHQILETIKHADSNADKSIRDPLNSAMDYFKRAINEIRSDNIKEAYNSLASVIDNIKKVLAFVKTETKKITRQDFIHLIEASQLLTFAEITRYSYDEENERFIPFALLPPNKVQLIGTVLEEISKDSLTQRDLVKTSGRTKRKVARADYEVQDILDDVLHICYPYISQAKGLTDFRRKIDSREETLNISVIPQFIPEGLEDAARVLIGTNTQKMTPCTVMLWRSEKYVFHIYETYLGVEKISSETEPMEINVLSNNCERVVMSSSGPAVKYVGQCLGLYYLWDPEEKIYKQFTTEHEQIVYEMYYYKMKGEAGRWRLGELFANNFVVQMRNLTNSDTVPETGWDYAKRPGPLAKDDTTIRAEIVNTPMSICREIIIGGEIAEHCPDYVGEFRATDRMVFGKPVFRNENGKVLYYNLIKSTMFKRKWQGWMIADDIRAEPMLKGSGGETQWENITTENPTPPGTPGTPRSTRTTPGSTPGNTSEIAAVFFTFYLLH